MLAFEGRINKVSAPLRKEDQYGIPPFPILVVILVGFRIVEMLNVGLFHCFSLWEIILQWRRCDLVPHKLFLGSLFSLPLGIGSGSLSPRLIDTDQVWLPALPPLLS